MSNEEQEAEGPFTYEEIQPTERALMMEIISDSNTPSYVEAEHQNIEKSLSAIRLARLDMEIRQDIKNIEKEIEEDIPEDLSTDDREEYRSLYYDSRLSFEVSEKLFSYATMAYEVLKQETIELIESELIIDEYSSTNKTRRLLSEFISQPMREDILLRMGVIGEELRSEMAHVRELRKSMVHSMEDRQKPDLWNNPISEVNRITVVINKLRDMNGEPVELNLQDPNENGNGSDLSEK